MKEFLAEIKGMKLPEGLGVAKVEGKTVFVPYCLLEEKVKLGFPKEPENFSLGNLIGIQGPSKFRTQPLCIHFGTCGGCSLQHIVYEEQLTLKENWLREIFFKELKGLSFLEKITPCLFSYFYRNKMEFCFGENKERIFLGLRKRNFGFGRPYQKEVVEIKDCPIFSKYTEAIFKTVLKFLTPLGLKAFNPYTKKGSLRHLVLKEAKTTKEIMFILVTTPDCAFKIEGLVEALIKKIPQIKSIWWAKNDRPSDVVDYQQKTLLYGKPYIEEKFQTFTFRIYPETFFQPNPLMAFLIYEKILENIKEGSLILSLYAGSGVLETILSQKAKSILGIDREAQNIKNAEENFKINNVNSCIFLQEKTEKIKRRLAHDKFDYIIVDPPRCGLNSKVIKSILALNCKNLIYLSCNPLSFARDIKIFQDNRYEIEKVYTFDFLPQTAYVESLGILKREY